jgi:hypothetical protein
VLGGVPLRAADPLEFFAGLAWNLAMRLPNVAARSSRQMTCRRAIRHNSSVKRFGAE